jgi:tetratricopeptide (TPR) repeat protein
MPLNHATPVRSGQRWLRLQAMLWLALGQEARAWQVFDTMLARQPDDAHALASRAHLQAQAGQRAGAITDLQALVAAHPRRSAGDWFNLAFLLEAEGRLAEAEAAFRQAVGLDAKLDRAWYGLGLVLIRLGRPDEAVPALRRNTELQPMSPYGWYQLARLQASRQQAEEAQKIIRHLRGFEPKVAAQLERETGLRA